MVQQTIFIFIVLRMSHQSCITFNVDATRTGLVSKSANDIVIGALSVRCRHVRRKTCLDKQLHQHRHSRRRKRLRWSRGRYGSDPYHVVLLPKSFFFFKGERAWVVGGGWCTHENHRCRGDCWFIDLAPLQSHQGAHRYVGGGQASGRDLGFPRLSMARRRERGGADAG